MTAVPNNVTPPAAVPMAVPAPAVAVPAAAAPLPNKPNTLANPAMTGVAALAPELTTANAPETVPTTLINLPKINNTGPIAAANAPILTMTCNVSGDKLDSFSMKDSTPFAASKTIGSNCFPNDIPISFILLIVILS